MITPEKFSEMMNPAKTFEAWSRTGAFDMSAQGKLFQDATEKAFGLVELQQAQTRKAVEFYLGQAETVLQYTRKWVEEWAAEATKTGTRLASEVEANVKEAAKVLDLPKPAKSTKAA